MVLAGDPCICRVGRDVDLAAARQKLVSSRAAISEPAMTGAIGQAVEGPVAAKAEILFAGIADRPAAFFFAQLQ